ncbi:MAG: hypothetical protein ACOX6M_14955 [Armatimonadota bacterium]|jgi:hypothetical protein|nr:hypothetical protein [Acidobacteriota bacterium]
MTCEKAQEYFLAHSRGEPVPAEAAEHLRTCPACADALREFVAAGELLGSLGPVPAREGFADGVMAAVRAEARDRSPLGRLMSHPSLGLLAAAASVLVIVGAGGLMWLRANAVLHRDATSGLAMSAPAGGVTPGEGMYPEAAVAPGSLTAQDEAPAAVEETASLEATLSEAATADPTEQSGPPSTAAMGRSGRAATPESRGDATPPSHVTRSAPPPASDKSPAAAPPIATEPSAPVGPFDTVVMEEAPGPLGPSASGAQGPTMGGGGYGGFGGAEGQTMGPMAPAEEGYTEAAEPPPTYTFRFAGDTLDEALERVADVSGVGIELEAGAYAQVRIHATLEDVTVDEAVERLSGMAGLRYAESADSGYVIMAEGPE